MKKLLALLMTVLLLLSMTTIAVADEPPVPSITITNPVADATYKIYRLLDLTISETGGTKSYSYKVNDTWAGFFATDAAKAYVDVNAAGYVTWKTGVSQEDPTVATFAQLALTHAKNNSIPATATSGADFNGTFSNLELGYYLLDSNVGVLCSLDTTNPQAEITEKNLPPTITKEVQEDLDSNWYETNIADIGEGVQFKVTITAQAGAENYVMHDRLSGSFALQEDTIAVTYKDDTLTKGEDDDYTVSNPSSCNAQDGCSFEIHFSDDLCDQLLPGDTLIVTYVATLKANAELGNPEDGSNDSAVTVKNPNYVWLQYGDNQKTTQVSTQTYTYKFDLVKTNDNNVLIDGATFKIYTAATGGSEIPVIYDPAIGAYRPILDNETGAKITVTGGNVTIVGFDNGTYYLEEIDAPAGYNKLTTRESFTINNNNLEATLSNNAYESGGVRIKNNTGSILPETGAMGTKLFVAIGAAMVLASGILLVTRKRMSMIQD